MSQYVNRSVDRGVALEQKLEEFCEPIIHGDSVSLGKQNIYDFAENNPDLQVIVFTGSAKSPLLVLILSLR